MVQRFDVRRAVGLADGYDDHSICRCFSNARENVPSPDVRWRLPSNRAAVTSWTNTCSLLSVLLIIAFLTVKCPLQRIFMQAHSTPADADSDTLEPQVAFGRPPREILIPRRDSSVDFSPPLAGARSGFEVEQSDPELLLTADHLQSCIALHNCDYAAHGPISSNTPTRYEFLDAWISCGPSYPKDARPEFSLRSRVL